MSLDSCRNHIDEIDVEILSLLARRIAIVREIAAIKLRNSLPIVDPLREAEILGRLAPLKDNSDDAILQVYKEIIHQSRQIQVREMANNGGYGAPSARTSRSKEQEINNAHR